MNQLSMFERLKSWKVSAFDRHKCLIQASWSFQGVSSVDQFANLPCPPSPYAFHLTLTVGGLGCCYAEEQAPLSDPTWIGQDARHIKTTNRYREVSLLDSVFGNFRAEPTYKVVIDGFPLDKSRMRAEIIADQVESCAKARGLIAPRVLMVGVVGKVMKAMHHRGMRVQAVDLSSDIIGQEVLEGVRVLGPKHTDALLAESDIALITGMAIVNNTLESLVKTCERAKTIAIVYGQTGSNFAPFYLENGVSCVISESFPLYTIPGCSDIRVFTHE